MLLADARCWLMRSMLATSTRWCPVRPSMAPSFYNAYYTSAYPYPHPSGPKPLPPPPPAACML
ncbi:hypothetical protein HaLaN_11360 [Haematococcus lacustris]|uniref:Uncharacterized protein n=1 Tax=Haematococcus lacustris TaxID=44745 RepID=A0A699Z040_HAELA|nr:hypothetical protein HaLaN_11360 [Haematococcus lacustris]